jgi:hypothetical protein
LQDVKGVCGRGDSIETDHLSHDHNVIDTKFNNPLCCNAGKHSVFGFEIYFRGKVFSLLSSYVEAWPSQLMQPQYDSDANEFGTPYLKEIFLIRLLARSAT